MYTDCTCYWFIPFPGCKNRLFLSFPPCYSQSPLLTDFTPPPFEQKWFETGLQRKHCIHKPWPWELSRLCPETSTKLYFHEFGFSTDSAGGPVAWVCERPAMAGQWTLCRRWTSRCLCCARLGALDNYSGRYVRQDIPRRGHQCRRPDPRVVFYLQLDRQVCPRRGLNSCPLDLELGTLNKELTSLLKLSGSRRLLYRLALLGRPESFTNTLALLSY